ncbi:hypothetical protein ER308_08975 [Egibacter rhizosphaerae]|uniref:Uncharacterized protein n=1 Tax=Egibacter rhizosphaerae TaxID=1670831 RepID=A0A411YEN3_9ACTN|nr:hypothetical protein [Egibacter rhizosphaerae]QBI19669.1 hypothetical protein ER308_08975 [Egibacter rhizosphaerae]
MTDEGLGDRLSRAAATPRLDPHLAASEVARRGRRRHRQRVAGWSALPVLVVLAGVSLVGLLPEGETTVELVPSDDDGTVSEVAVPPEGETAAAELDDGSPVFVVHHDDGDVDVLSAVSTHLDHLVVWCAPEQVFIEPVGATVYEADGQWQGGPAHAGLAAYDVEVVEHDGQTRARVGYLNEPPERPSDEGEALPGECDELTMIDGDGDLAAEPDGVLLPTPFHRHPIDVADLESLASGTTAVVEATLDLDADPARLCNADREGCSDAGVTVASSWWHDEPLEGYRGATVGRFLVRIDDGAVGALAQLRRETSDPEGLYHADDDLTRAQQRHDLGEYGELFITPAGETCLVDADGRTEHCADLSEHPHGEPSVAFVDHGAREADGETARSLSPVVLAPVPDGVEAAQMLVGARGGVEPAEVELLTEGARQGAAEAEDAADHVVTELEPSVMWGRVPPAEECVAYALLDADGDLVEVIEDVETVMPDEGLTDFERNAREEHSRGC